MIHKYPVTPEDGSRNPADKPRDDMDAELSILFGLLYKHTAVLGASGAHPVEERGEA